MLIRSQDKRHLINLNTMNDIFTNEYGIYAIALRSLKIGQYSTEEKAIKALDMIQTAYENSFEKTYWQTEIKPRHSQVFQMPTDEEAGEDQHCPDCGQKLDWSVE